VANDKHLTRIRQGTVIWNGWRRRNPKIRPDLRGADLREANLREADLFGADLSGADLTIANLREANLIGAYVFGADLRAADLSGAYFVAAYLHGANFTGAVFFSTILGNVDLSEAVGLGDCRHLGPSIVDFRTLYRSRELPISFLRGCGLPDRLIEYLPSLRGEAIQYYSCFISYSVNDQLFAERLHADMQNKGVRCWFAPHDLAIGAKIWDAIDEAIRLRDKLLVILSEASIASDWVEDEVNNAYAEERERKATLLFPIRIDDAVMHNRALGAQAPRSPYRRFPAMEAASRVSQEP
jgi:TIR domain/Pentapeptide repeats (8 copies)